MFKSKTSAKTVEEYIKSLGIDPDALLRDEEPEKVTNMDLAAKRIKKAAENGEFVFVVADYDCDGVMSGCIMEMILEKLKIKHRIRFPRRMSEGYGISEKILDEAPAGSLIITVDNGISAVETIDEANKRGHEVVIIDHHLIRDDLRTPNAAVTVNPHIIKRDGEFDDYCGAGLSYVLTKELELPETYIGTANVLAAIATVADVVKIRGANYHLLKRGLMYMNERRYVPVGIQKLIEEMRLTQDAENGITETDLGFSLGPCINAMGRMIDDGAKQAFNFITRFKEFGIEGIRTIVKTNETRKAVTKSQQETLEENLRDFNSFIVEYVPGLHEGVIGINAAQLAEEHFAPAIVLTDDKEGGFLKGSGRSYGRVHMKAELDRVSDLLITHGGHEGAAGLSLKKENLQALIDALNKNVEKQEREERENDADIEIESKDADKTYRDLKKYAPYGEGFKSPTVLVKNVYVPALRHIRDIGVSFNNDQMDFCTFQKSVMQKAETVKYPKTVNVIGELGFSSYSKKPQLKLTDIEESVFQFRKTLI